MPRHCRVTGASIKLCRIKIYSCRVTLMPHQCRIKPAHQHFSCCFNLGMFQSRCDSWSSKQRLLLS
ncbi:hypothetical protein P692DRAFT_20107225 [Suillus brevipes Sb2]|nr:hypothetical protein P692DRAFT_20107225 [Suillus brevipes Sb2]